MSIAANIEKIKQQLSQKIKLIAVSKTKPVETLMEAYHSGQKIFGENKVQELVGKFEQMPKDIEWHMIGHLQSNKVKYIVPFVALIHSVDSENILFEINKQAAKINKIQQVLLQISIADEETKFGFENNLQFE
jgi:pyridoxal phosphate enzyme (YggS family)